MAEERIPNGPAVDVDLCETSLLNALVAIRINPDAAGVKNLPRRFLGIAPLRVLTMPGKSKRDALIREGWSREDADAEVESDRLERGDGADV